MLLTSLRFIILSILLSFSVAKAEEPLPKNVLGKDMAEKLQTIQKKIDSGTIPEDIDMSTLNPKKAPKDVMDMARTIKSKGSEIANQSMAVEKDKVLKFLGIDPLGETDVYVFITWNMPLEMIRSYVAEAMWAGGSVILKGVPEGRNLKDFITSDLTKLVYDKGASADVRIDPRLWDAYDVKVAPTIVLTKIRTGLICDGNAKKSFEYAKKQYSYDTCKKMADDQYWKVSGGVTLAWALQTFENNGAKEAAPYLAALEKGYGKLDAVSKDQKQFQGDWKQLITPSDKKAVEETVNNLTGSGK